ncbi:MAG: alpha/beta fold hydrolase, partial [Betaproteobacteria bacterium]|nr:alpha/beta fold hydrolase [Betaproteobacteria bacterium]
MSSQKITFIGANGAELAARLDLPLGGARAYAIFAHCFTCSKDTKAATYLSAALAEQGIATLRFDFTGLGGSGGDFANTNFSSNVADLVAAADYLRANHGTPEILIGHSLGGAAVLAAAPKIADARAVATINAPFDPAHVLHMMAAARPEIELAGEAEVTLGGRPFRIKKQFIEDLEQQRVTEEIKRMKKALLVMHAPLDVIVNIDNAAQIFLAARHPKSFVSLDGADHLLSRREDAMYAGSVLAAWAARYIARPLSGDADAPRAAPGEVIVAEAGTGKFEQTISAGRHRLRADEPVAAGGADNGPSPYDLLLAGLGACTSMTIRMYAAQKQWPLAGLSVKLTHAKVYAEDCAGCDTKAGKIDRIEREITIEGDLDGAQREKLLEIANKCPVHRTLNSEVWIPT